VADRVAIIGNGRIIATGTLDQLRSSGNQTLEDIFLVVGGWCRIRRDRQKFFAR